MAMTSPSTPLKRWTSTSPSAVESLLTLISTLLERVGLDKEHHPPDHQLGKTLR
jgi:hypothetical protein